MDIGNVRPKNLGLLFVVGGYGGSGATTISKLLSKHFNLKRVYAGGLMRDIARKRGYEKIEDFLSSLTPSELMEIDKDLDKRIIKYSYLPNVLIDSKVFAALATKYRIPCTVKIWLDCDLDVRANRKAARDISDLKLVKEDLLLRFTSDKERYEKLYNIDYSSPKKYNDIVINITKLNESQTLKLILDLIKDGGYISK